MRLNNLVLEPARGSRRQLLHEGQVAVEESNRRWCSDGLKIACWNCEAVRVVFVIDAHDREIISWIATTGGISGEMIRDMMVEAVERRFGCLRAPQPVKWLSDNGSPYTARQTIDFAPALGLVPCFTPVASPESNGLAEAFVKTFKRDCVRLHERPNAAAVLRQLADWFTDYNEVHPHQALKMRSPREYLRSQTLTARCPEKQVHTRAVRMRPGPPRKYLCDEFEKILKSRARNLECVHSVEIPPRPD